MSLLSVLGNVLHGLTDTHRHRFVAIIYSDSDVVLSIFRQLGVLEKSLLGRLLLLDRSIKESLLMHWAVVPGSMSAAVRQLSDLCILQHDNSGERLFDMEPNFRRTLNVVISSMSSVDPATILVHSQKSITGAQSQKFFFQHSPQVPLGVSKWHAILERIISPTTSIQSPTDIDRVVSGLGFGAYPPPPNAYKFVLSDTCSQLWTLISQFFTVIETTTPPASSIDAVALSLRLVVGVMIQTNTNDSFVCTSTTSDLDLSVLSRTLGFLEDLDIVKRSRSVSPRTSLAVEFSIGSLAAGLSRKMTNGLVSDKNMTNLLVGAQLIVDSNMHVTAYTQSSLQNKLIGLFCCMQRMLCGKFLVGILTRESVQRAIEAGVSSETICKFLAANLHVKCGQSLPQNVINQLRIWESDYPRNRIKMDPVIVLSWRLDRSEQTNRAIDQIKHKIDPYNGLLFTKVDEAAGKIHLGIKADIAREYLLGT